MDYLDNNFELNRLNMNNKNINNKIYSNNGNNKIDIKKGNNNIILNLVIIIVLILIIIYVKYDLKYSKQFELIQLSSDKLNKKILFEKHPVIVEDKINDIEHFMEYILDKNIDYPFRNKKKIENQETIYQNLSNFCYIQNINEENIWVYIAHPSNSNKFNFKQKQKTYDYLKSNYRITDYSNINDTKFLKIKLNNKQIVILPKFWLFYIQTNNLQKPVVTRHIHSTTGFIVSNFIQMRKSI
jgi:hypothetical protein